MTKVDLAATMKQAQKDGKLGGGSVFKFEEGANRMRIVDGFLPHNDTYLGKPNFKWLTRIIDRRDGKIKAFFMGHTVYKQLLALQQDPEYAFDELPLPFDININAENAGTIDAKYSVIPARQSTPISEAEKALIDDQGDLADFQEALFAKKGKPTQTVPDFDPEEIPF